MERINPKINSALKYHGGKSYLAKDIIPLLPDCEVFVDATVGAGNIILNLKPNTNRKDYAIDLDHNIITLWKILQSRPDAVKKILDNANYEEATFTLSNLNNDSDKSLNPELWAAKYIIRNRMSRGGLGKTFAWSERLRGGKPGDVNAWENFLKVHYPRIINRIQSIEFLYGCMRDQLMYLNVLDNPNAVVYIDPPYVFSSRVIKNIYKHEMPTYDKDTDDPTKVLTHEGIWAMIRNSKCRFYVSGYYCKAYEDFGAKIIFSKDIANHSGQNKNKQRRIETVWCLV